jgi:S1-C subfamily serine protease
MPFLFATLAVIAILGLAHVPSFLAQTSLVAENNPAPFAQEIQNEALSSVSAASVPISYATTTHEAPPSISDHQQEPTLPPARPKMAPETDRARESAERTPGSGTTTLNAEITRTTFPYSFPQLSLSALDTQVRAALVNVFCESNTGPLPSTSGSGVIIDPRGVIVTNAHVAQYFLLEDLSDMVSCKIRAGSPARTSWRAQLLFLPSNWVKEHADEVLSAHPLGTGEDDYALLLITGTTDGGPKPSTFPSLPFDSREAIGFTGDQILAAAYPAEFMGGSAARNDMNILSTVAEVKQMMTFSEQLVDVFSLGGTALAQGGSSGGAAVNLWGYLVGMFVTTSEGTTTAARDLRAVTFAHVDRSIRQHTGQTLQALLAEDVTVLAKDFQKHVPSLAALLLTEIEKKQH